MTSGSELITGLTNLIIMFTTLVILFRFRKLKIDKKKMWYIFYISVIVDSMLGFIIHSFMWSSETIKIMWIILSFVFCITLNSLLFTVIKCSSVSKMLITSIVMYLIFIIETVSGIDFLLTFIVIALFYILYILWFYTHKYIKTRTKKDKFYIIAIVLQIIGGLFLLFKIKVNFVVFFDKNGIYHMFMIFTIIFMYLGNKYSSLE